MLVQLHKSKIEKIAYLLMKKNIISGDELYAALNLERPLYECEKTIS